MPHPLSVASVAVCLTLFTGPLLAQCANVWAPGAVPGTNGTIRAAVEWDPDGPGPAASRLAVAGTFTAIDGVPLARIAAWDDATGTWSALGSGLDHDAYALCAMPNGELVVGGTFAAAGGVPAARIARWNGAVWAPFGTGATGPMQTPSVTALAVRSNGELAVAGNFAQMDGVACAGAARFDGSTWTSLATPWNNQDVLRLRALVNGDLVAVGAFATGGYNRIARWNGAVWSPLGTGTNNMVADVVELANGDLLAAGVFTQAGGQPANSLARWNGTAWSAVPSSFQGGIWRLQQLANLDVVAFGNATLGSNGSHRIDRWNGSTWTSLGAGAGTLTVADSVERPNGDVVVVGGFSQFAGIAAHGMARWSAGSWSSWWSSSELGAGFDGRVRAIAIAANGDVVAVGSFVTAGGVVANRVARWDGTAWSALGAGVNGVVNAAAFLPNGDLVIAGPFTTAGGVPAAGLALWDGSAWSEFGGGLIGGEVKALAVMPNGDLIAGGSFTPGGTLTATRIARWDGFSWWSLGSGVTGPGLASVNVLRVLAGGALAVGGSFTDAGGTPANCIAIWDGAQWRALGAGTVGSPLAIVQPANGDLVVGGSFTFAGGAPASNIARYVVATSTWSPLGGGTDFTVRALALTPDGDVIAAGDFVTAGGVPVGHIARWNGTNWAPIAGTDASVYALQRVSGDDILAAGDFFSVGGAVSPRLARLTTDCPAFAVPIGLGCAGNVLAAVSPPWVDATFRTQGTGLPPVAIVVALTSFTSIPQGAVPLSIAFPQAVPGCDVLVAPDILDFVVTVTGTAEVAMFLPSSPPLVGQTFFHQMLPIELGPGGTWLSVSATNGLQVTAGAF